MRLRHLIPPSLVFAFVLIAIVAALAPKHEPSVSATGNQRGSAPERAVSPAAHPLRADAQRPSGLRVRPIAWRSSVAVGEPEAGSLKHGVHRPKEGRNWVSWDPVEQEKPNRPWRRWGTDRLLRATLGVIRDVDRFVAAGAEVVFVGPSLPLSGPAGVVIPLRKSRQPPPAER